MLDLDFSEEQGMLRRTVRGICATHSGMDVVRRMEADERGYPPELWSAISEAGILGLRIEEARGGIGLGCVEATIAWEEFGRALAPGPMAETAVFSARLLSLLGDDAQRRTWLPRIATGDAVFVPAWMERGRRAGLSSLQLRAEATGGKIRLSGAKLFVPYANSASRLLVVARHPREPDRHFLAMLDPACGGVSLVPQQNHADTRMFEVHLTGAEIAVEDCLGFESGIGEAWGRAFSETIVVLAGQAAGGADAILEMATDYAKERIQFSRAIGGFQALAHDLSDRITEYHGARTLVYQAAWAIDQGLPYERLALMAKLKAGSMYREATALGTHIYGGYGYTREANPQLFFRRAKHQQLTYGDPAWLEERIAECVLDRTFSAAD